MQCPEFPLNNLKRVHIPKGPWTSFGIPSNGFRTSEHCSVHCSPFLQHSFYIHTDWGKLILWSLDQDHLKSKPGGRLASCTSEMRRLQKIATQTPQRHVMQLLPFFILECRFPNRRWSSVVRFWFHGPRCFSCIPLLTTSFTFHFFLQGKGSACHSLLVGFVGWEMGPDMAGSGSLAIEVAPHQWPQMRALICVISDDKKGTSPTS